MTVTGFVTVSVAAAAAVAATARAEEEPQRPSEEEIFGEPAATETAPATDAAAVPGTAAAPAPEVAPEDPLTIGGTFYLRGTAAAQHDVPWNETRLSMPMLVDGYFDARPNPRLRGMVVGRLQFDPTIDPKATSLLGGAPPANPNVLLDQMWMRFDIARTVFVTLGKQPVKWGASRFFNPADFIHPVRRDPLALFDLRTGVTMLKLHLPWEERNWNLYAIALLDNLEPARMLERVGGAARAEIVVGTTEIGLHALVQQFRNPRIGADVSAGVGPFDVYAEVAAHEQGDTHRWRKASNPDPALGIFGEYEAYLPSGWTFAASGGFNTSWVVGDNDQVAVGAEYFFNPPGYADAKIYPWLLFKGDFQPFYTGQHYAGLYAYWVSPGDFNDTNLVFSTIGNLSDLSFISRFDFTTILLTHLRLELFAAAHYGAKGGEFRLEIDVPSVTLGGQKTPPIFVPAPLFDLGVALRVNI